MGNPGYIEQLETRIEELLPAKPKLPPLPYENQIQSWWFSEKEILSASKSGKLLTLDLDIGKICNLKCSFCFANTHSCHSSEYERETIARNKSIVNEGSALGLKSIKIVGAGEPLLFSGLIDILEEAKRLKISSIIFTNGEVLGSDKLASAIYGKNGIKTGLDLARKLKKLDCSFVVKFMTLKPKLQNKLVNVKYEYHKMRDEGLLNLIKAGLNRTIPTRLGVDCLLLETNYKEAVSLFKFFNRYNIFCVFNTSMECGKTESKLKNPEVLSKDEALATAIKLYRYCQKNNIPFDKRISPYFLSPVCSQLNHGLFIGDNDEVRACPGGPKIATCKKGELQKIWESNKFRTKYCGEIGHECISRVGLTYHKDFEKMVRDKLKIQ